MGYYLYFVSNKNFIFSKLTDFLGLFVSFFWCRVVTTTDNFVVRSLKKFEGMSAWNMS